MKSTIEQLSGKEREILGGFYEMPSYKVLKKLCQLEIDGLAKDALVSQNQEQTRELNGQAMMASKLPKLIRGLYMDINKEG